MLIAPYQPHERISHTYAYASTLIGWGDDASKVLCPVVFHVSTCSSLFHLLLSFLSPTSAAPLYSLPLSTLTLHSFSTTTMRSMAVSSRIAHSWSTLPQWTPVRHYHQNVIDHCKSTTQKQIDQRKHIQQHTKNKIPLTAYVDQWASSQCVIRLEPQHVDGQSMGTPISVCASELRHMHHSWLCLVVDIVCVYISCISFLLDENPRNVGSLPKDDRDVGTGE